MPLLLSLGPVLLVALVVALLSFDGDSFTGSLRAHLQLECRLTDSLTGQRRVRRLLSSQARHLAPLTIDHIIPPVHQSVQNDQRLCKFSLSLSLFSLNLPKSLKVSFLPLPLPLASCKLSLRVHKLFTWSLGYSCVLLATACYGISAHYFAKRSREK